MSSSHIRSIPHQLSALACWLGVVVASNAVLAAEQPVTSTKALTQIGRYSVMAVRPTTGQLDLLSATMAITIPSEIERVGEAVRWLLRDSGYRLADDAMLAEEVRAMLELPLPVVHRRFQPMPLKTVIALMVGPAFHIVQDPVHRLMAFERCGTTPDHSLAGEAL